MRQFGQVWVLAFLVWLLGLTFFPTQSFGGVVGGTTGMACIGSDVGDTAKIGYDGSPVSHSVYDGRSILAPVQTVMRPESGCGILAQLGKLFAADTTTALSTYRVTQEGETFIRYESAIPESGGGQSGGNTIQRENQGPQGLTGQPGASINNSPTMGVAADGTGIDSVRASYKALGIETSSTSTAASRGYTIYQQDGTLFKFGVTDADFVRMNQSLKMAGPGSYARYTDIMPKYQAHLGEKYLRSLQYNSTGVWPLPGMKVPYPNDFTTQLPVPPQ